MTNETSVSCIPEQAPSFVVAPVWNTTEPVVEQRPDEKYVDQCYENLRVAIGKAFKPYFDKGSVFFRQRTEMFKGDSPVNKDTLNFNTWLNAIADPEIRQQYNCDMCRANWGFLFNLAVLEDDYSLTYPAIDALLATRNDSIYSALFLNAPKGFVEYLQSIAGDTTREYFPMTVILNDMTSELDAAGWSHFHLACKEDADTYNRRFAPFNDFKYIDTLANMLLNPALDLHTLKMLFDKVKAEVGLSGDTVVNYALGNVNSFLAIAKNARAINDIHRGLGVPYIWTQLCDTSKAFLQHVQGSVLGIVLDAYHKFGNTTLSVEGIEEIVARAVGVLRQATATENYKLKTSEAKAETVKQTYNLLKENGWEHVLERRLLTVAEVESFIWKPTVSTQLPEVSVPATALDAVYDKVMASKDLPAINSKNVMSVLEPTPTTLNISLRGFLASLENIAEISLVNNGYKHQVTFKTTSVCDGDYTELLNFHGKVGKNVLGLTYAQPITFSNVLDLVGVARVKSNVVVSGIYTHTLPGNSQEEYILQLDGLAENMSKASDSGSCVLGSMVKSKRYGLSGALAEMSSEYKLGIPDGVANTGGVAITKMTCLHVMYKDGTESNVTISSLE